MLGPTKILILYIGLKWIIFDCASVLWNFVWVILTILQIWSYCWISVLFLKRNLTTCQNRMCVPLKKKHVHSVNKLLLADRLSRFEVTMFVVLFLFKEIASSPSPTHTLTPIYTYVIHQSFFVVEVRRQVKRSDWFECLSNVGKTCKMMPRLPSSSSPKKSRNLLFLSPFNFLELYTNFL